MPQIELKRVDRRVAESNWLLDHECSVYSQHGEDGVIQKIFDVIGPSNKWCVEFGASDGVWLSNTCNLIRHHGWSSVQIEGNKGRFTKLVANYADNPKVHCLNSVVGFSQARVLDQILSGVPDMPQNFDLLSIDIDGNDWHVWDSLNIYKPRVVIVEFNPTISSDVIYIQDQDWKVNQGSSLLAFVELARQKGYELTSVVGANAIFVVDEEFSKLGIQDNSIDAMYFNVRDGRFFLLYDGTIVNAGIRAVSLRQKDPKKRRIGPFHFQMYEEAERGYGGAISLQFPDD